MSIFTSLNRLPAPDDELLQEAIPNLVGMKNILTLFTLNYSHFKPHSLANLILKGLNDTYFQI